MKLEDWSKIILSYYSYLEQSVKAIDKFVLDKCVYTSYFDCGLNFDIEKRFNKVMELIDKKRRFINLKVIIEKALTEINEKYRKILVLFYIDKVSCEEIAKVMGLNLRPMFRHKNLAIESFTKALSRNGFNLDYFQENYAGDKWLFMVNTYQTKNGNLKRINEYRLLNSFL